MTNIAAVTLRPAPRIAGASRQAAPTSFQVPADVAAGDEAPAVAPSAVEPAMLSVMLAAEAVDHRMTRDAQARRHGQAMMTALGELQHLLLAGDDTAGLLARLADLTADPPQASDPGLAVILGMVGLRARVELARRMR